ncbi:MAG: SUMF1/EgtB/PvdO family nonheme iron enzyme [Chloroflexi bacterium]|nr:SUMF1/EgtB/PvdO family nonheme iron enzyme [Chloroflexota bacterium]
MGDDAGRADERPAHRVWLSAVRLALLPVTNREYAVFLAATGHETPRFWDDQDFNAASQPVVGVSWNDAVAYCEWLCAESDRRYRLPTEAEREKASRGGLEGARFPWGDDLAEGGDHASQEAPRAVGLSAPNGYGLFDMAYNVHEWCSDWYDAGYYASSPERDPQGPPSGTRRASRGGAWRHQVKVNRCAARSSLDPTFRYNDYGFRVALDVE